VNARGWLAIALLIGIVASVALVLPRLERTPPTIGAPPEIALGREARVIQIEVGDLGTGLRSCDVKLLAGESERTLLERNYPGHWLTGGRARGDGESLELRLDAAELSLPDGPAVLAITARDWSWRDGFLGNLATEKIQLVIDTTPPAISLETGLTYLQRGGSGLAIYRVDGPTTLNGVLAGGAFFKGYPLPGGGDPAARPPGHRYAALFAIPVEAPESPGVQVVARDAAGNEGTVRYPARVSERAFPRLSIPLTQAFLAQILGDLTPPGEAARGGLVEAFRRINSQLRSRNEEQIRELAADSQPRPLWSGAFEQLRGTQVTSDFAEQRSYVFEGEEVSEARHYGFDLASTSQAEVTAAAAGVVRHADQLGIYGKLVLLDHGMGLASLYGHLSRVDVKVGDRVDKGEPVGRTGTTGLAGGDHLHFAILVGETYVNPLEWWDPKWVRSHIEVRLEAAMR
jgi:murein DD-endopeptidase MepM/ murein hydrolase activator NlpD